MADAPGEDEKKKRQPPPPVEFLRPGETQAPLPARGQTPAAWVPRPEEYQRPTSWMPPSSAAPATSNLPKVAGGLLIISPGGGMSGGIYNAVTVPSLAEHAHLTPGNLPATVALLPICGLLS